MTLPDDRSGASVIPLRDLALMVANRSLSVLDAIGARQRRELVVFDPDKPTRFTFTLDRLAYATTLTPERGDRFGFHISARLGAIPFTVQSSERRALVARLIKLAGDLPGARLVRGAGQSLWVTSRPTVIEPAAPDTVLYETLEFIRRARPYTRLVRPYLNALPVAG